MLSFVCICFLSVIFLEELVGIVWFIQNRPTSCFPMNRACRKRRSRLVVEGPLAPYFEPYPQYLADQGYSQVSYWNKPFPINEFLRCPVWGGLSLAGMRTAPE